MIRRLVGRCVLEAGGEPEPTRIEMDGGFITAVTRADGQAVEAIVAPGFIDLQVNGHEEIDVAGATGGDWDRLDEILLSQGVTAWCPTLVTAPLGAYPARLEAIAWAGGRGGDRPAVLGAHLEGPFLGSATGAHDRRWVRPIDLEWLDQLPATVRIVTLGAELDGLEEAVGLLTRRGVTVSLGHSGASWEEARAGSAAGARLVTHLYNAMSPLQHRAPGMVGAALTEPDLVPSLVADNVHVHPVAALVAFRCRQGLGPPGDPGVVLVTDAVAWRSGAVGGRGITRAAGDAPRLPDGTIAGSALRMNEAVANVVAAGVPLADALAAASRTPARVVGEASRGRLQPGARADLVVLDPDLSVRSTWVGGVEAWSASP